MKALENRTVDSKREMEILDALQDIRSRNARNEKLDPEEVRLALEKRLAEESLEEDDEALEKKKWEEEDERLVREVFSKVEGEGSAGKVTLKRKADGEAPEIKDLLSESSRTLVENKVSQPPPAKKSKTLANSLGIKTAKRRPAPVPKAA